MNFEISLKDYTTLLNESISRKFNYVESEVIHKFIELTTEIQKHVYTYEYRFKGASYILRFHGQIRPPSELTDLWLLSVNNYSLKIPIDQAIQMIYENISTRDINLFIEMSSHLKNYVWGETIFIVFKLIKIFKKITNLDLSEFVEKFASVNRRFPGPPTYRVYEIFEKEIIELNNSKISELWWNWRDFSGEYKDYVEWFPRETLDDLLMVKNLGKYQPDYTTYVKI